jgi:filamentous hemagglutinin
LSNLLPYYGSAAMLYQAVTGQTLSGQPLDTADRWLSGILGAIPVGAAAYGKLTELVATKGDSVAAGIVADAGSVKGVNPTGSMQNCTNCVAVVDNLLVTGNPASALPLATPVPFDQLGNMYGTTFSSWTTRQGIESSLLAGGNGTRAVIYGTDGVTGHVWNAVVQNGRINYIDGQIGASGAANFDNFSNFRFGVLP